MATKAKKDAPAETKTGTAVARAKVQLPVDIAEQERKELEALSKRLQAPTGNRITVTQSKTFKLPNGDELDSLECIVVDFMAAYYYYTDAFERGNITPPACFALGLEPTMLVPHDSAPNKQAEACAGCWANQFGSSGKGKACQNTRLLAVMTPDATDDAPLYLIKVSPTAIKSFDAHVGAVARTFVKPIRGVVTRISFSEDAEYASMRFSVIGPCTKDQYALATSRKVEAVELLSTPPDYSSYVADEKPAPKTKKLAKPQPPKGRSR